MGKEGCFTTVGTGERLVGAISTGQVGNALLAVLIVTAREDLGLLIVVMANSTRYFLL